MPATTMSSKGQFTMPKEIRDELRLAPGSRLLFVRLDDGRYLLSPKTGTVDDFIGMLHDPSRPPMTIDEMNDAIAEAAAAHAMGAKDYAE